MRPKNLAGVTGENRVPAMSEGAGMLRVGASPDARGPPSCSNGPGGRPAKKHPSWTWHFNQHSRQYEEALCAFTS